MSLFKKVKTYDMKLYFILLIIFSTPWVSKGQDSTDKMQIMQIGNSFIRSWNNHDFSDMASYTTKDLNWVNHSGKWWKSREEVQKVHQTPHSTFLKTATTTLESSSVRFITPNVAILILIHKTNTFYPPDGVDRGNNKQGGEREIKSMVVIKQKNKWLLTHNHTTTLDESAIK